MTHFHFKAARIELFDGLLHRRADIAAHSLPILFLQTLGNGKVLHRFLFARRPHPEFQLRRRREDDVLDVLEGEIFHPFHRMRREKFLELRADVIAGIFQNRARIDAFPVVNEETRNAERPNRAALFIDIVVIVIDVPIHRVVRNHVDARIVERGDIHQHDGRAVRLDRGPGEEIIVIFQENFNRNLFIRIVSGQIDADQGNETDFRMLRQEGENPFFSVLTRGDDIQQFTTHHDEKRLLFSTEWKLENKSGSSPVGNEPSLTTNILLHDKDTPYP